MVLQFGRESQKNEDGLEESPERGNRELGRGLGVHIVRLSPKGMQVSWEKGLRCAKAASGLRLKWRREKVIKLA